MASAVFIAALLLLVATAIAVSLRDRPLARWLRSIGSLAESGIDDSVLFLGVLLLFDLVALALLVRFGTTLN